MFGWRARVGLMVPSSNTTAEIEFQRSVPDGVSVHAARMHIVETTVAGLEEMTLDIESGAQLLATLEPDVIAFACTTGSLLRGVGFDRQITDRISHVSGTRAIATASAVLALLKYLTVRKLVVFTPYIDELNRLEQSFFEAQGFEVLALEGLRLSRNLEIGAVSPSTVYRAASCLARGQPDAQALFVSCTNLSSMEVLGVLSSDLAIPVLSSNQATIWACLTELGIRPCLPGLSVRA